VTELPGALRGAQVPAGPFLLPDRRQADAILLARLAWDASAGAHPDAAADAVLPALAVVPCVEKLAVPAPVVPGQGGKAHWMRALPAEVAELYKQDAGQSAA
jgi:hypothetical protein